MPRFLFLILAMFPLVIPAQEYGPQTLPQSVTIRGTVTDPALLVDGPTVGLSYLPWDQIRHEEITAEVGPDGSFVFNLEESTIREYSLIVGDRWMTLLAKPGEEVVVNVENVNGRAELTGVEEGFTRSGIELAKALMDFDYWPALPALEPGMDAQAYLAALPEAEKELKARLATIVAKQGIKDEYLLSWARQFVENQLYHDAVGTAFMAGPGPDMDKMLLALTFPERPRVLEPMPVYADGYLLYVGDQDKRMEAMLRALPRTRDPVAGFYRRDSLLSTLSEGLTRDYLQALLIKKYIDVKFDDPTAIKAAQSFIDNTAFPMLAAAVTPELLFATQPPAEPASEQKILDLPIDTTDLFRSVLADHAGEVVVIDLWATWCGPCKVQFRDLYPKLIPAHADQPVAFIFASVDDNEKAWARYVAELPFSAEHVWLDKDRRAVLRRLYRVTGYPYELIYRPDGTLYYGGHIQGRQEFAATIAAAGED